MSNRVASTSARSPARRRRARWIAALIVLAALAALWFLRAPIASRLVEWAARRFGGTEVALQGLELQGLSRARVVHVSARDGTRLRIEADGVEIEWDPWRALDGAVALRALRAARLAVDFDATVQAKTTKESPAPIELPRVVPAIVIDALQANVRLSADERLELGPSAIDLKPEVGGADVHLAGGTLTWTSANAVRTHPVRARAHWRGREITVDELAWDPRVALDGARAGIAPSADVALRAHAELRAAGGAATIDMDETAAGVHADVTLRDVDLARFLDLFDVSPDAGWGGLVTLHGSLELPASGADPTFDVAVEAGNVDLAGRKLDELRGHLSASASTYELRDVFLADGPNAAHIELARAPRDLDRGCALLERATWIANLDVGDVTRLFGDLDLPVLDETERALPRHRALIAGSLVDGWLQLDSGTLDLDHAHLDITGGRVPLMEEAGTLAHDPRLDVAARVQCDDVEQIVQIFAGPESANRLRTHGSFSGRVRLTGSPAGPSGRLDLRARNITAGDVDLGEVDIGADLDPLALHVEKLEARGPLARVAGSGVWQIHEKTASGVKLSAHVADLSPAVAALGLGADEWPSGALDLELAADGPLGALDGALSLRAARLAVHAHELTDVDLHATARAGAITIAGGAALAPYGDAQLEGELHVARSAVALQLARLELRLPDASFALTAPARIEIEGGTTRIEGLHLAGSAGALDVDSDVAPGTACIDVRAASFALGALIGPFSPRIPPDLVVDGFASAQVTSGTLELTTRGSARARMPAIASGNLGAAWDLDLADGRAVIRRLDVDQGDDVRATIAGSFPLAPLADEPLTAGAVDVHVAGVMNALQRLPDLAGARVPGVTIESGSAALDAQLSGTWAALEGRASLGAHGVSIARAEDDLRVGPIDVATELKLGRAIVVEKGDVEIAGQAEVAITGRMDVPLDVPSWIAGKFPALPDAPVDLRGDLTIKDLAPIASGIAALRRVAGAVEAHLQLGGTLRAPTWNGTLTLANGEVRTASQVPTASNVDARLEFDGRNVKIASFRGEFGGAPFELGGGLDFSGPVPMTDVTLRGQNLLLARTATLLLRADADLHCVGPLDAAEISGAIDLRDCRYTQSFNILSLARGSSAPSSGRGIELFRLHGDPFENMRFAVDVRSKGAFRVDADVAHVDLRPDLKLAGTGGAPLLIGPVFVDAGRVLLPTALLRLQPGRVDFRAEDPGVARLDLRAKTQLPGYEVTAHVAGTTEEPLVELTSVPPASQEDLTLLVMAGRQPGSDSSFEEKRVAGEIAAYVARDVVGDWFGDVTGAESFAERLEIATGADVSQRGLDTVQVRFRLTGDDNRDRFSMYLVGERDAYEFVNYGVRFVVRFK